ncbi:unnamed protein product [Microthlaspi erraticum]|uniref:Integrase catalytic domain-containing protein n=1 Tax=Microthlaspi erraticum TaxID=1685480 RepID=A0A6D2JGT0_9BRAS|nr:unnamed protein product [Microthlaspi erraticum]
MYHDLKRYYHWVGMKRDVALGCEVQHLCLGEGRASGSGWSFAEFTHSRVEVGHDYDGFRGWTTCFRTFDAIWVIVDRLTKSAHFLAIKKTDGAAVLARKFVREIAEMGTKVHLSTAYHPQTDGQSERTIQTLEDLLRMCVLDWGGQCNIRSPFSGVLEVASGDSRWASVDATIAKSTHFNLSPVLAGLGPENPDFEFKEGAAVFLPHLVVLRKGEVHEESWAILERFGVFLGESEADLLMFFVASSLFPLSNPFSR